MESYFQAEFFRGNRERLRKLFTGKAPIVIASNGLLQRSGDSTFAFRQDSSFWYLTGINEPDLVLFIDKDKEYLITAERDASRVAFDGDLSNKKLSEISGIKNIVDEDEGEKLLNSRLKKVKHIATLAPNPSYIARHGFYANPARRHLLNKIKVINPQVEPLDLSQHLVHMRAVKQVEELKAITAAVNITSKALKEVKRKINKYGYEYEIEADITKSLRKQGSSGHAYQPIVAGGVNACTLHYIDNNAALSGGSLILLDVGAEVSNYAADITRTYAAGKPSKRQRLVYEAVLEIQEFAKGKLEPGVLLNDYEEAVKQFCGEKLRELGLMRSINQNKISQYFPHRASHFLGLDVHDVGDYKQPLEPGMVLTIEPGIYIPKEGIGVRIEDDVLITKNGIKVLSSSLPRNLS